jgi:cytochrome c-type biogenesis protein CcmE
MTSPAPRNTRLFAFGALAVAGIAFAVIAVSGINKNLVYYWSPTELQKAGDKAYGATIRLGGLVAPGSVHRAPSGSLSDFDVTDHAKIVHVRASGIPPQMFREGIGVVVEGTMVRDGYFRSDRLMVSHNNEYRAPKAGEKVDTKELIESTKGIAEGKKKG